MPYDEQGRHIKNASAKQWADYHRKKKMMGSSSAVRRHAMGGSDMSSLRRRAKRFKRARSSL